MSAAGAPRVAPGTRREVGIVNAVLLRVAAVALGREAPHVFTTLARHPRLFRRWLLFAGGLMPGGRLPRDETELAILRVARNTGCDYEWDHHERLGRRAGLSADQIARVRSEQAPGASWTRRHALVLRATDALHADGDLDDALWAELSAAFDERELIELCLLVGHYEMLAMTLRALRVAPDPPPRAAGLGGRLRILLRGGGR